MAEKMYYTEEEAAVKLRVSVPQLTDYARDGKIQQYQDGAKKVYRVDQVDQLAAALAMDDTGEIELTPGDTATGDAVSLSEAEVTQEPGKEDTVITAEGISIFDDEDLEIEAADPMAKTQIAPSLEDQIAIEGVGSGSGLLDLTRESDDTSLGAEVFEHIDMESGIAPGLETEAPAAYAPPPELMAAEAPVFVEAIDASAGLFSGLVVGSCLIALMLAAVMISAIAERSFAFIDAMDQNMGLTVGVAALVVIGCGIIGFLLGKSIAARQAAIRKVSG